MAEPARDRLERVGEVAPPRRRVGAIGKAPARPLPAGERVLRLGDLRRAHALEEIVPRVVLADVVEAQEAPAARPVEIRGLERRLELSGRGAAGDGAPVPRAFHAPMQPGLLRRHWSPL